jgi:hypothetical protein
MTGERMSLVIVRTDTSLQQASWRTGATRIKTTMEQFQTRFIAEEMPGKQSSHESIEVHVTNGEHIGMRKGLTVEM